MNTTPWPRPGTKLHAVLLFVEAHPASRFTDVRTAMGYSAATCLNLLAKRGRLHHGFDGRNWYYSAAPPTPPPGIV